jgi:tetratricopeptide (TPR) repeat protein
MSPTVIVRFGALVVVSAGVILGQGRGSTGTTAPTTGGGTGTPTTGSTPTTTTPGRTNIPTTTNPQQTQQPERMQQPIFISGRVMLEDGTPAANVVIERVCSGSPHSEGYTDSKGYFSIQLGAQNNAVLHDASEDMGFGRTSANSSLGGFGTQTSTSSSQSAFGDNRYIDCEIRARMPGYRSQVVPLANRRPMDPPDIGIILLHNLSAAEGTTVSAVSLNAPKDAKKAYDKALDAMKKKKTDDAVKNLEKAVEVYPKFAAAWNDLGRVQMTKGDVEGARKSFQTAMDSDPKFVGPYLEMAMIEWKGEKWQNVADLSAKVIKLDSFDYPQAHFLNALSNYYLKNLDDAEKSAREALRLDTRKQYPTSMRLLGVILANKQDYNGAVQQFKAYLAAAPQAQDVATVRNQLSQVEKLLADGK